MDQQIVCFGMCVAALVIAAVVGTLINDAAAEGKTVKELVFG
jgi:hypothetical protein